MNADNKNNTKVSIEKIKSTANNNNRSTDFDSDGVSLIEDDFAQYFDEFGDQHAIKRFTWQNKNKIQVQVLNYGARVISIKMPDRKGEIEDILLGFDDLAGYIFYDRFYFGSIIGRTSHIIKNSSFTINNKKITLSNNYYGKHHMNGGFKGLDKVVWETFIKNKTVIMSCVSPHLSEGYPGDLLVRVFFELSAKNEFKVSFEAQTTAPTVVDLSHLLYFNLAGHHRGPDEIYRHNLTLNCNCFTPQMNDNNKMPTGEIFNVLHSQFDFQIPKLLGKVMGIVPKDGFDQNLCVNRGMYQNECFVARVLHPPTGRMLEVYSNQPGVQFSTANDFGYGNILSFEEIHSQPKPTPAESSVDTSADKTMLLFEKVHNNVIELLQYDAQQDFSEIKQLILKLSYLSSKEGKDSLANVRQQSMKISTIQHDYLKKAREIVCENEETDDDCLDLKDILSVILHNVEITDDETNAINNNNAAEETITSVSSNKNSGTNIIIKSPVSSKFGISSPAEPSSSSNLKQQKPEMGAKFNNAIPVYYKNSNQIRGKSRAVYRAHGAIALQTQNYPNAINIKQFPNSILNPGEVYKHDIVYRFWIRAGNPSKWIKRNLNESKRVNNNNNS